MKVNRTLTGILIVAAIAGLSACGGGGSSDPVAYVPISPITAPPPGETGLRESPTKVIDFSPQGAQALVDQLGAVLNDVTGALAAAPYANALAAMASESPTTGCDPNTGTLLVSGGSNPLYTFNQCGVNGHVFDGTATLIRGANSAYTLDFSSGITTKPAGGTALLVTGSAACEPSVGAAPRCVIDLMPAGSWQDSCAFGYDSIYQNGAASGTQFCESSKSPGTTWLVTLVNMTSGAGGTGLLQASNGQALFRRQSAKTWDVELTPTGGETKRYTITTN